MILSVVESDSFFSPVHISMAICLHFVFNSFESINLNCNSIVSASIFLSGYFSSFISMFGPLEPSNVASAVLCIFPIHSESASKFDNNMRSLFTIESPLRASSKLVMPDSVMSPFCAKLLHNSDIVSISASLHSSL